MIERFFRTVLQCGLCISDCFLCLTPTYSVIANDVGNRGQVELHHIELPGRVGAPKLIAQTESGHEKRMCLSNGPMSCGPVTRATFPTKKQKYLISRHGFRGTKLTKFGVPVLVKAHGTDAHFLCSRMLKTPGVVFNSPDNCLRTVSKKQYKW